MLFWLFIRFFIEVILKAYPPTYSCKDSALNSLSRRDHGQHELTQKLLAKGFPDKQVEEVIHYCLDRGYLDELRYVQSQIRQHINKGHGERRIRQTLLHKKANSDLIDQALEEQNQDWFELAKEVAQRKFRSVPAADQKEYARQIRFLQYRGFSFDQIHYALEYQSK
jgi:regulatory protein